MRNLRALLTFTVVTLSLLLSTDVARALDPESTGPGAMESYLRYERTLTTPPSMSLDQRSLLAASLAAMQSPEGNKAWLVSDLLNSGAVVTYQKMSDTSYYWLFTSWMPTIRNTYTYGSNHLESQEVMESYDGLQWTNSSRNLFSYDGSNRSLATTYQNWVSNNWQNWLDVTNTYDGGGNITEVISRSWAVNTWVNSTRTVPTYSGGRVASVVQQIWNGSIWVNANDILYTYNGGGQATEILYQHWSGAAWADSARTTNAYNGQADLSQSIFEFRHNSAWRGFTKGDFTYDGSHHEILAVNWNFDTLAVNWVYFDSDTSKYSGGLRIEDVMVVHGSSQDFQIRHEYSYDGASNLIEDLGQSWLPGLESAPRDRGPHVRPSGIADTWTNTSRTVNVYSVAAVGELGGDGDVVPRGFSVSQNYPNPFNMSTVIDYSLDRSGPVRVVVSNTLGQTVATLVDAYQDEGTHSAVWNGSDGNGQVVASGIYFYRIQAAGTQQVRKMVLLK